ncbi:MAG: VOC family protein [Saccharospirillum sp.]
MHAPYPNTLVWLDIPVLDLDRAIAFYEAVLALAVRDLRPTQAMAVLVQPHGGVSCSLILADGERAAGLSPLPYFNCQRRLELAVSQVADHGGQIEQGIHPLTPFGYRCVVKDSEGNRIALHSPELT